MSTNFYLTHKVFKDVPYGWIKDIHIGKYSNGSFSLQAVISSFDRPKYSPTCSYLDPVQILDESILTWQDWKKVILNEEYVVINEYTTVLDKEVFISEIESQENRSLSHEQNLEFFLNRGMYVDARSIFLDPEGYSFEYHEYS